LKLAFPRELRINQGVRVRRLSFFPSCEERELWDTFNVFELRIDDTPRLCWMNVWMAGNPLHRRHNSFFDLHPTPDEGRISGGPRGLVLG
jgi:hypothetical protein